MLRRLGFLSGAIAAGALLFTSPARAFCRSTTCAGSACPRDENQCKTTGAKLFWPGLCVGFSLQRDGTVNLPMTQVRPAIESAFVAWSDLDCGGAAASIAFAELRDVRCNQADYDEDAPNANVVLFQDTRWTYRGVDNTLAKTTVTYDTETGEIFDADIEVNHAYNEFTVGDDDVVYDLQSVVTHEVGHFIGLDHTQDLDATMSPGYSSGTTALRTVEPDDVDAVCAAYPPGRDGRCESDPRNGLGDECSADTGGAAEVGCALSPGLASGRRAAPLFPVVALGLVFRAVRRVSLRASRRAVG